MRSFRFLVFIIAMLSAGFSASAQDPKFILKEAQRLEHIPNEKASLEKYKELLKLQPLNLTALVKCSELSSRIAGREPTAAARESFNQAAIIYARTAYKHFPNDDNANVAMAIAIGRTMLRKSNKEKLSIAREVKQYTDAALKINPNNFKAWHVLGKWHYEIVNLSAMERTLAKVFLGGLPTGSLKKSIASYEKARTLNPEFALNYLELARAYDKDNNRAKALQLLKALMQLPMQTEDDPRIKKNAGNLIKAWEND